MKKSLHSQQQDAWSWLIEWLHCVRKDFKTMQSWVRYWSVLRRRYICFCLWSVLCLYLEAFTVEFVWSKNWRRVSTNNQSMDIWGSGNTIIRNNNRDRGSTLVPVYTLWSSIHSFFVLFFFWVIKCTTGMKTIRN